MNLEEMKSILPPHTLGDFATVDGDQADIRGWQFQIIEDNRIYFCTSNQKMSFASYKTIPIAHLSATQTAILSASAEKQSL